VPHNSSGNLSPHARTPRTVSTAIVDVDWHAGLRHIAGIRSEKNRIRMKEASVCTFGTLWDTKVPQTTPNVQT